MFGVLLFGHCMLMKLNPSLELRMEFDRDQGRCKTQPMRRFMHILDFVVASMSGVVILYERKTWCRIRQLFFILSLPELSFFILLFAMNFGGPFGGGASAGAGASSAAAMMQAEYELDMMTDVFYK